MFKNILLIGMPGSGKTILGKKLSKEIGYNFVDMDKYICDKYDKSIKELFEEGEESFRDKESEVCKELSNLNKVVISSGGGVVKRGSNMLCFERFLIVFINRPLKKIIKDIDTSKRPLLKNGKDDVIKLYKERIGLYKRYKDIEVLNNGNNPRKTVYILKGAISDENNGNKRC